MSLATSSATQMVNPSPTLAIITAWISGWTCGTRAAIEDYTDISLCHELSKHGRGFWWRKIDHDTRKKEQRKNVFMYGTSVPGIVSALFFTVAFIVVLLFFYTVFGGPSAEHATHMTATI
jgi:hypothetical protein